MVRIEGTLDEIRELVGDVRRTVRSAKSTTKKVAKAAKKTTRKLSAWQKYIKNKRNHIKFRDGKLNLKKMGVEFRRKKRR